MSLFCFILVFFAFRFGVDLYRVPIYSQELVINNQYKMLGLCDFSNEYGCVESKWRYNDNNKKYLDQFKYQLYITSNGRPVYIMVGSKNKITIKKAQIIVSSQ